MKRNNMRHTFLIMREFTIGDRVCVGEADTHEQASYKIHTRFLPSPELIGPVWFSIQETWTQVPAIEDQFGAAFGSNVKTS
jgi:hypothetical protein